MCKCCACCAEQVVCCCCSCAIQMILSVLCIVLVIAAVVGAAVYFGIIDKEGHFDKNGFDNIGDTLSKVGDNFKDQINKFKN